MGLVASAAASSNQYTFSPGVTLQAGNTYYFFASGSTTVSDQGLTSSESGTATANVTRYRDAGSATNNQFWSGTGSTDFTLNGTVSVATTSVPEPSSLVTLGGAGLTGLVYFLLSRSRKKAAA